jgi:1-acyl-sn-glycerol-3-phosphate acyltransferase
MFALLNRGWRLVFTGLSFALFGMGSLILGAILFLLLHIFLPTAKAERLCRYGVHLSFRCFIGFMHHTGVLDYKLYNSEALRVPGQLIVANHPCLIDVIFIIAEVPDAFCVVKAAAWKNPFMSFIMSTTGYIQNTSPTSFINDCVAVLERGDTLVMFPEGTRTKPKKSLKFNKGVARIALAAEKSLTPVHLYTYPTTLTKGEPWYHIPKTKFCFYMNVGAVMEPKSIVRQGPYSQIHVKTLTRYLMEYFETKNSEFANGNTF